MTAVSRNKDHGDGRLESGDTYHLGQIPCKGHSAVLDFMLAWPGDSFMKFGSCADSGPYVPRRVSPKFLGVTDLHSPLDCAGMLYCIRGSGQISFDSPHCLCRME